MKPKLKIGPLTNLQDARSSAAVGFDLISFSLERGSTKKLPASSVWSIVNWLSGPEIGIELNVDSLAELEAVQETFSPDFASLPASEWSNSLDITLPSQLHLRADASFSVDSLQLLLEEGEKAGIDMKIELRLASEAEALPFEAIMPHVFLHFPALSLTQSFAASSPLIPYGFALGEEAEEEPNQLDYEKIDDFLEMLELRYP